MRKGAGVGEVLEGKVLVQLCFKKCNDDPSTPWIKLILDHGLLAGQHLANEEQRA